MLGSAPYAYVTTRPLSAARDLDPARFEKLVLEGIPGYLMPANGDLSRDEVRALYEFASSLRGRPPAAGANRS